MVFELIQQNLSTIVKHVDAAVVQRCKNPRTVLVERKTFDTFALGLEFVMDVHLKL